MSAPEPGDTMIDALRRANPVPAAQAEGRRSLPSAHALFAEIVAQPQRPVRSRSRRRVLLITIAVLLIALVIAGFVVVRRERAPLPLGTSCYAAADLDARVVVIGSGGQPARDCARFWTDGTFGSGSVPDFDVCVLSSGVPGVFPGESGSVCGELGLPQFAGGGDAFPRFAKDVNDQESDACIGPEPAEVIVRDGLERYDLTGWTVARDPRPFNDVTPCATLAFDPKAKTITILAGIRP